LSIQALTWVLGNAEATLGARCVIIALANYADADGEKAFPSVATLAEEARMSRKGVQDALRRLEEKGEIVYIGLSPYETREYAICGMSGGAKKLRPAKFTHENGVSTSPEPSFKPSSDSEVNPSLMTLEGVQGEPLAPSSPREVWATFVKVMKPRRRELDDDGRRIIVAALKVATVEECINCIEASATSDYHQKRGQHATRKGRKYNRIGDVLKPRPLRGETQRDRIDFWLERQTDGSGDTDEWGWTKAQRE
jgi:hypothetical protein